MNRLRDLYKENKTAIGTFCGMGDMSTIECLGYTGLDYVVIDTEHGPFDTETAMNLIRAAESTGLVPVVRIADVTHKEIQRMADCGAQALIIPCLRTMEDFKKCVDLTKFAPIGNRGFIKGRGTGFGNLPWADCPLEEFMKNANERLMLMPQCETVEALENIEEIAAIDGIDGIFIGPFDLSITMGIPGQFTNPDFVAAVDRIKKACDAVGKPVYIYTSTVAEAKAYQEQGYAGVANSINTIVLVQAYKQMVKDIKE